MRAPETFVRLLEAFDTLLSVRWGPTVGKWVIQRKSFIGDKERVFLANERARLSKRIEQGKGSVGDKTRYAGVAEEHECSLVGCRVILFADVLDENLFNILAMGDMKRYGGYSRYADMQERDKAYQEAKEEKDRESKHMELHQEMFGRHGVHDFIVRKQKSKLQHGERNVKKLLGYKGEAPWEHKSVVPQKLVNQFGREI